MKTVDELMLPAECRYTPEHIWIRKDGKEFLIGISDFAQDQLGDVVFVDMPEKGQYFTAGDEFGSVESVKSVNQLFMPLAGKVVEVNAALEEAPNLLNQDCYGQGWILRIAPEDAREMEKLMDASSYRKRLS